MSLIVITPPSVEPVTLAEAKLMCKVDTSELDTLFNSIWIPGAREEAEHRLGRALLTQTLELVLDTFPDAFRLINPPIQAITSVRYIDTNGIEQILAPASYSLDKDSEPGWLVPAYGTTWPDTRAVANAVRVRYTAGYASAAAVPSNIKSWILMAINTWYNQPDAVITGTTVAELPRDFFAGLLDKYWIPRL